MNPPKSDLNIMCAYHVITTVYIRDYSYKLNNVSVNSDCLALNHVMSALDSTQ